MSNQQMTETGKATTSWPPAGFVDRHGAARMFGVSASTFYHWECQGRVTVSTQIVPIPGTATRTKLYPVEALRRALEELKNPPPFPPEGFVDRHEAARMFGISDRTWSTWEVERGITCGRTVAVPGKAGLYKIYPVGEIRRLVAEFKAAEERKMAEPFPPPGFVGRHEARRMFGLSLSAWEAWERKGRISPAMRARMPGQNGRCKLYAAADLERLKDVLQREEERVKPYPDPQRPGCWRVPLTSEKHAGMEAVIDAESLPVVQGRRWWWSPGNSAGGKHGTVVLAVDGTPKPPLGRIIMGVEDPGLVVSHLNGDRLDCRRENLVVRDRSLVKAASTARQKAVANGESETSSRYVGVSRRSRGERWLAVLFAYGERRPLGRFRSEIGAALAYDEAAREVYGEQAPLNFPDPFEAARMREVALAEESAPPPVFPPPGMIDRRGACRMFGVVFGTWEHWERTGRVRCGQWTPRPFGKPGRCRIYPIDELNRLLEEFNNVAKPYPDPERGGCYRVPIRSMIHRMEAIIDSEDLPLVAGKYWNWHERGDGQGGRVVLASMTRPTPQLDRVVAGVTDNELKVRHINGDALDCRKKNLVVQTMAEQAPGNRKMGTVNGRQYTSKFKGVSWSEERGKWVAQISKKGVVHRRIGRFHDELAAAAAYDEAARELFGEHARLNFPDGVDAWLEQLHTQSEPRAEAA